jgi:hypothetical protein
MCWRRLAVGHNFDYTRFRKAIEHDAGEPVGDAYYFNSDNDPPTAAQNNFHTAIARRPPDGPGLRVKLGSLQRSVLHWPDSLGGAPITHPDDSSIFYEQKSQKEVDVLLAFYLTWSQAKRGWKKLYLVAGDRDFFEPVKRLVEDEGVELTIFGTKATSGRSSSISSRYDAYGRAIYFDDIIGDIEMTATGSVPHA